MKDSVKAVIDLRTQGKSYKEIVAALGVAKSTVSYICTKYVSNNNELRNQFVENYKPSSENLRKARIGADQYYQQLNSKLTEEWIEKLQDVATTFIIYILGLYDGEGTKKGTEFSITNSNKDIVLQFIRFLELIECPYSCSLYLHTTHKRSECLSYWNIPIASVIQIDSRQQKMDNTYRENYGTIHIRAKKANGLKKALYSYRQML